MTNLSVVSTITTIPGTGIVELGHIDDLANLSVGQVKRHVEQLTNVPAESQKLWWRGYILDENTLPLTRACVGVNEGETVDRNSESLVLFMTVDIEQKPLEFPTSPKPYSRLRAQSFDLEKIMTDFKTRERKCIIQ